MLKNILSFDENNELWSDNKERTDFFILLLFLELQELRMVDILLRKLVGLDQRLMVVGLVINQMQDSSTHLVPQWITGL